MSDQESDSGDPTASTEPRRVPPLREAIAALAADADVFGVLGYGSSRQRPPVASPQPAAAVAAPAVPQRPRVPATPISEPATVPPDPEDSLERIQAEAAVCLKCPLGSRRIKSVPGQGNPHAELMFVGEAPGADEDEQGLAFVGAAGQLLTKMIQAMGFARDEVFIGNVLKCRPPNNREPQPDEVAQCLPFLDRQIRLIKPRVICALGSHAAHNVLRTEDTVGRLRGKVHRAFGSQVVVTYHPAYLLRSPGEKKKSWEDLKFVLTLLGRTPPTA